MKIGKKKLKDNELAENQVNEEDKYEFLKPKTIKQLMIERNEKNKGLEVNTILSYILL